MIGGRRKTAPLAAPAVDAEPMPARRVAAAVELELVAAQEAAAARDHELATATEAYVAALDIGTNAAVAARHAMIEAEVGHAVAARGVDRLQAELREVQTAEAEAQAGADSQQALMVAVEKLDAYRTAFVELYPAIVASARTLLRLEAEATLASAAARKLGVHIEEPNDFRGLPARSREVLGTEVRQLWRNPYGGSPFGDDDQRRIEVRSDGSGQLPGVLMSNGHMRPPITATHRQPFEFTTVIPGRAARPAVSLAEGLRLPAALASDLAGWDGTAGTSAASVLKELARREVEGDAGPADDLSPKVEKRALGPAVDVTRDR